jgi:uncharacterized protein (TIGR02270 family)
LVHYIPWILTIACNWSRYLTANDLVVDQQGDQASHLWLRRDAAVAQPHYTLADLAKLDGQLEGNLDGLRIAGGAGWTVAERELLRWREPGEVFAAAVLAFESGAEQRVQRVLALAAASNDCARAVVSALGWLPCDRAAVTIDRFLAAAPAALRRIGIAASSVHRRDPGQPLVEALESEDAALQARALRAIGELGRRELLPLAAESLDAADERVRSAAAWSTALLAADARAADVLKTIVENCSVGSDRALPLVLSRMEAAQAVSWIRHLQADPKLARPAIRAAGLLGVSELVDGLIEHMRTTTLARLAGEAFCMIAGVQLARVGLEGKRPAGFESGPSEDPADDNVATDPDENLPWPDQDKIAAWWEKHEADFTPGMRYLLGKPISEEWLEQVLRHGFQRQRAAAALELAIRRPGTPLFEVRAPGFRQQELLG